MKHNYLLLIGAGLLVGIRFWMVATVLQLATPAVWMDAIMASAPLLFATCLAFLVFLYFQSQKRDAWLILVMVVLAWVLFNNTKDLIMMVSEGWYRWAGGVMLICLLMFIEIAGVFGAYVALEPFIPAKFQALRADLSNAR